LTVDQYPDWFSTSEGVNDYGITKAALDIMEQADIIVAHYGERFDRKFLNSRCAIHGLTPPPPTKLRDTWRICRTAFNFSSNRLKNLANVLGLKNKKQEKGSNDWPGWWIRAMAGDVNAIHDMAKYCAQDVETLEELYLTVRKYDNMHPLLIMDRSVCGICGGAIQYRGVAYVGVNRYRRYQCKNCGRWGRETKKVD